MDHIVAIPLDSTLASFVGKKGSENSITFYNRQYSGSTIVALAPSSIEEKFYGAAEAMCISHKILLSTSTVDRLFGEMVVAASLLGKKVMLTNDNDVTKLLAGSLNDFEIVSRESVLDRIISGMPKPQAGGTRIDIDKAFVVRGVGTVVLGVVTRGSVKVHDELFHSSGKKVVVKSIQSQDKDIQEAGYGTRVGLALKGIDADAIDKGDVISGTLISKTRKIRAKISVANIADAEVEKGKSYGFVSNFTYANAVVGENGDISIAKPVPLEIGDDFLLLRESVPRIFAKGTVTEKIED